MCGPKAQTCVECACRCEISGGVGPAWPVAACPLYDVNDNTRTVTLIGIAALAPQVCTCLAAASVTAFSLQFAATRTDVIYKLVCIKALTSIASAAV